MLIPHYVYSINACVSHLYNIVYMAFVYVDGLRVASHTIVIYLSAINIKHTK